MKRPPDEEGWRRGRPGSADERLGSLLQRWSHRYPRLPRILLGILAALIVAGLLLAIRR